MKNLSIGTKIVIAECSGILSGAIGYIVNRSEVKTNGRCVPVNIYGAYKPLGCNEYVIRLTSCRHLNKPEGVLVSMFKNRVNIQD